MVLQSEKDADGESSSTSILRLLEGIVTWLEGIVEKAVKRCAH